MKAACQQSTSAFHYCQRSIRVRGIVQGVGFRPTVWRYAKSLGLRGYVINDGQGVKIECAGFASQIDQLIRQISESPPPQARITGMENKAGSVVIQGDDFVIADSDYSIGSHTSISPDLASCDQCLADINAADNRRFRYPFTNCTHCGPRLSIIRKLPYDRDNTSMADFHQCTACSQEYENPADRRFHAQPNACPHCGPTLWLSNAMAEKLCVEDAIADAQHALCAGEIVAIKGLGGFQLAVDAANSNAVFRLRERKNRPTKPFALMARDLRVIEQYCLVNNVERQLLMDVAAPVVILHQRHVNMSTDALAGVAPGQRRFGFMLPTTPLHHILLADFDRPLVMTSGNPSGEPQCIDNDRALAGLADIADVFLLHDRDILHRVDDSVVQVINNRVQMLRRARGYAPAPLALPEGFEDCPETLALGAELKNTFCLLKDNVAVLSQHIGDLQDAATLSDFEHSISLFKDLYELQPAIIAVDEHPQYLSSQSGDYQARQQALPLIKVQHHHAHIAACLGGNLRSLEAPPVLGVALDGLGFAYGSGDAEIWGGEILLADYCSARRVARLKPIALAGGDLAMQQPWRNCLAHLHSAFGWSNIAEKYADLALVKAIQQQPYETIINMIDKGFNSPSGSSCGRLFDAVAAALGFYQQGEISFEGEAPMAMEAAIDEQAWAKAREWPFLLHYRQGLLELDPKPLWQALLDDLQNGFAVAVMAASFYKSLAGALARAVQKTALNHQVDTVALSGGCFQSPRLQMTLQEKLEAMGFEVLTHHQIPANDGGISFGQALVAAATRIKSLSHLSNNNIP